MAFFSKRSDYYADLGNKLRDLYGFAALGRELVQNARDARATVLRFDIQQDGLLVENDSRFTDCGKAEELQECPRREGGGLSCDFHRFRKLAAGEKRDQEDTIGTFGIGFTSVFQVTDSPHLVSSGRHWILREDLEEEKRFESTDSCSVCKDIRNTGVTRFWLPWARDSDSRLRKLLRAPAVPPDVVEKLGEELRATAESDILFLDTPRRIEISDARGTWSIHKDAAAPAGVVRFVFSTGEESKWHLLEGLFAEAAALKARFPNQIEAKRRAEVSLAFRGGMRDGGRLFAFLPTEVGTALPFHVHADFMPDSSRKRIEFEGADAHAQWNRAARLAAARLMGRLGTLRHALGPSTFWAIVGKTWELGVQQHVDGLEEFWNGLMVNGCGAPMLWASTERWEPLAGSYEARDADHTGLAVLRDLGTTLAHASLKPYYGALASLKVGILTSRIVASELRRCGVVGRRPAELLPDALRRDGAMGALRSLICSLAPNGLGDAFDDIALARGSDGAYWPLRCLLRTDDATLALFEKLGARPVFLSEDVGPLNPGVTVFGVEEAVAALERVGHDALQAQVSTGAVDAAAILHWFSLRPAALQSKALARRLAALPLFASGSGYRPLVELSLPSNFRDPLGVADLVDPDRAGVGADFLRTVLGAGDLDVISYARTHAARAFTDPRHQAQREQLIAQLALHHVQLQQDDGVRSVLARVPSVRCADGQFRLPAKVHFASPEVESVLGDTPVVRHDELAPGVAALYEWLGVAHVPRPADVYGRIESISSAPPTPATIQIVRQVFAFVARNQDAFDVSALGRIAWLPAEGQSRWFLGSEVQASISRWLFESQGRFLDIPRHVQLGATDLLNSLDVLIEPTMKQIVDHLLYLIQRQRGEEGNRLLPEIDKRCGNIAAARAVLPLHDVDFLWCQSRFFGAQRMFWGEHPFGRRAVRLDLELRSYQRLFTLLEVQESPTAQQCVGVIQDLSAEFGAMNRRLPPDELTIALETWRYLGTLTTDVRRPALSALRNVRSYPDCDGILAVPQHLLIADSPQLQKRFARLRRSIIDRIDGIHDVAREAGARPLSMAAEAQLLDSVDPREDAGVREILDCRRLALQRVVGSDGPSLPETWPTFVRAAGLTAHWTIRGLPAPISSEPEHVSAVLIRRRDEADTDTIYFVAQDGSVPWLTIARELAEALAPGDEPGRLAAALKEVLQAQDDESARLVLDALGFHSLTAVERGSCDGPTAGPIPSVTVDEVDFGAESEPAAPPVASDVADPSSTPVRDGAAGASRAMKESGPIDPVARQSGVAEGTDGDSDEGVERNGQRLSSETELDGDIASAAGGRDHAQPTSARSTARAKGPRTRKLTYVSAANSDKDGDGGSQWTPLDHAGVKRVLRFEHEAGRRPRKMPHHNPGFDVESRDANGNLLRYIEVKSHAGDWDDPLLSRRQFRTAQEIGDRFWLYVVERAQHDDFRITCIQDPANQVTSFAYDCNWRQFHDGGEGRPVADNDEPLG